MIRSHYSQHTGAWNIESKFADRGNIKAENTYGTTRVNGYKIIEETLNLRDLRIFDYVEDKYGNRVPVLNKKETAIAQGKQQLIKQAFQDWIWKDPARRERLTRLYNDKFNSIRPREYDGSHLNFVGINPEITLRPHQVNAIAHILYGGNTLLAHVVGAGKTFEMVAAAQESKRLGLCQKSLFVVPNHLTEQWASEYLQLYPSANILVATRKDFETKNRKRFCGRIATGDYDAIIIGHSQFEKIPVSVERQRYQSPLDELFDRLEMRDPEHIALKYYRNYRSGSGKTLKSIQITLVSRLEKFNLESLAGMTQTDEMELWSLGEKKTAIFAVIPDNDSSFNFIVGLLYTQLFQQLYYQADVVHGGRLPVHVHFVMDEFANVALPDEFDKLLATMRSREISVSIIIQNLAQLKALFEKQWESLVGNCDEFLYMGGNEQSTHEYVSKLLGKETIDTVRPDRALSKVV